MEKIIQSYGEHLKSVRLYLDDIEKIVEICHQVPSTVSLSAEGYSFIDINELSKLKKEQLTQLTIRLNDPFISVDLQPNYIWLYIDKDEPISRGIFEQIKKILITRERKLVGFHIVFINTIICSASLAFLLIGIKRSNYMEIITFGVLMIVTLALIFYSFYILDKRYSVVILKHKMDAPSFWRRNVDKILLIIFSAIFGGVITLVLFKVFGIAP